MKLINTDLVLKKRKVNEDAIAIREVYDIVSEQAKLEHQLASRRIVLWPVVIVTSIIPLWLMLLLTLSGLGLANYSEKVQLAFLGATAFEFLGICYVVTTDLFPKGRFKILSKVDNDN